MNDTPEGGVFLPFGDELTTLRGGQRLEGSQAHALPDEKMLTADAQ